MNYFINLTFSKSIKKKKNSVCERKTKGERHRIYLFTGTKQTHTFIFCMNFPGATRTPVYSPATFSHVLLFCCGPVHADWLGTYHVTSAPPRPEFPRLLQLSAAAKCAFFHL